MKKKFFAVAMAATMALSTVMTASAATADVDITGGLGSGNTGDEVVTGDFDVTYTFHNASYDTSANWNNFAVELYNGANFITMRADAFGWGAGDYQSVLDGATTWTGQPEDWAVWAAGMADADVTVNVKRSGNVLTFTYDINAGGTDYHFVGVTPEIPNLAETLNIHLTGEKVNLTDITFTTYTSGAGGEDPTTDEETTIGSATDKETTTAVADEEEFDAAVTNGPEGAYIEVAKVTDSKILDTVKNAISNLNKALTNARIKDNYVVLDVNMLVNAAKTQPNGTVVVTVNVPTSLKNAAPENLVVLRMEEDGTATELKTTVKDGKDSFETDHFSTYVISEKVAAVEETTTSKMEETTTSKTDSPKTGESSAVAVLGVVAVMACAGVVVSRKKFNA